MNDPTFEYHPEAILEAWEARRWYAARSPDAADSFMQELGRAETEIREGPDRWGHYLHGTRRYLLHRFPYVIVYRESDSGILVLAVAHGHRKPGYWRNRLSS